MKNCFRTVISSAIVLSLVFSLFAAKFWEKKPDYTTWTEDECRDLLKDSPWSLAFTHVYNRNMAASMSPNPSDAGDSRGAVGGETMTGEREVVSFLQFRLLTAKPIKMAIGQLQLLQNPNNEEAKKRVTEYVEAGKGDQIVFQISYSTRPAGSSILRDWDTFFRQASLPDFQNTTYLTGSPSGNIRLSGYRRPDANNPNPVFTFPRLNEKGEPYFTGAEKSVSLRSDFTLQMRGYREKVNLYVKLDPKKMVFNNQFEF